MPNPDKIYYHGTETRNAYAIMTQGFKLGEISKGRRLGRGLYISTRPESAVFWSHFITIKCKMKRGIRILWIKEGYDPKIIRQLRREFGKEILELGPHFAQAIPHNKQLTKSELISLCNYFFEKRYKDRWRYRFLYPKGKRSRYWDTWEQLSPLHEQARLHDYDALGDRTFQEWDSDEILIFNPSCMTPISAHWMVSDKEGDYVRLSPPLLLAELKTISAKAQEEHLRDLEEEE
jgi:hypothetical protein